MTDSTISRRDFIGLAATTAAAIGLAGCGTQVDSGSDSTAATTESAFSTVANMTEEEEQEAWKQEPAYGQTITVGFNGGACLGGLGIAQSQGFVEDEGLSCEIISMTSASDAVGTGKVDCAGDHIATLLVPAYNGVKLTFTTASATGCKSLYVLSDSDIQSTSDLVGKNIGLTDGIGASDQHICMRFLEHDNIKIDSVNWKAVTSDAIVQALQSGDIDAAMLSDQFAYAFVQAGTVRYIRSITWDEDFQEEPCCVLAFNTDFINENPVTAKKYSRAFRHACEWIEANKEAAVDDMLANNWASGDREVVLDMCKAFNFGVTQEMTTTALHNVIEDYKRFDLIEGDDDVETIFNKVWAPVLNDD